MVSNLTIDTILQAVELMKAVTPPPFNGDIHIVRTCWPRVKVEAMAIFPPHPLWLAAWRIARRLGLARKLSPWTAVPMTRDSDPFIINGRMFMSPAQYHAFKAHTDDLAVLGGAVTPVDAIWPSRWQT